MKPFKTLEQLEAEGWNSEQLQLQCRALERGDDLSMLDASQWQAAQMRQQSVALRKGVDVSSLNPMLWDSLQMMMQHEALAIGYDLSCFDPTQIGWEIMDVQGTALESEVDVLASSVDYDWAGLTPKHESGRAFAGGCPTKWTAEQMFQQLVALECGLDLSNLDPQKWTKPYLEEQFFALHNGLDLSSLDLNCLCLVEVRRHREALERGERIDAQGHITRAKR